MNLTFNIFTHLSFSYPFLIFNKSRYSINIYSCYYSRLVSIFWTCDNFSWSKVHLSISFTGKFRIFLILSIESKLGVRLFASLVKLKCLHAFNVEIHANGRFTISDLKLEFAQILRSVLFKILFKSFTELCLMGS